MFGFIILSLIVGSNFSFTLPPGETVVPEIPLAYAVYEQVRVTHSDKDWQEGGVPVCTSPGDQWYAKGTPDGKHGVITCWWDTRTDNVYAQRLDKDGNPLWQINGIPLFTNPTLGTPHQLLPQIISDGDFGAIVVGNMGVHGEPGFYAQRVDSTGALLWGENGIKLSSRYTTGPWPGWLGMDNFQITHDGSGGAIIVFPWNGNVYAQRVDATGAIQWGIDGVVVLEPEFPEDTLVNPSIISDGKGGAIIASTLWTAEGGIGFRIFAQRVDSEGVALWGVSGVHTGLQDWLFQVGGISYPRIVSDGKGGAIISHASASFSPTWNDIYVQRVDSTGNIRWGADGIGVVVDGQPPMQAIASIKEDGEGGAILCWIDARGDSATTDIYAQRIDSSGNFLWDSGGVAVTPYDGVSEGFPLMVTEWDSSVIIVWSKHSPENIYAQRLDPTDGLSLWEPASGRPVVTAPSRNMLSPWGGYRGQVTSDENKGVVVFFGDDRHGNFDIYCQHIPATLIGIDEELLPGFKNFSLYPNPTRGELEIGYALVSPMRVDIGIYDIAGRRVRRLESGKKNEGIRRERYDISELPSGIYFIRCKTDEQTFTRKFILLR